MGILQALFGSWKPRTDGWRSDPSVPTRRIGFCSCGSRSLKDCIDLAGGYGEYQYCDQCKKVVSKQPRAMRRDIYGDWLPI